MPAPITTQDLLTDVRAQTDEANAETVTNLNIMAVMNRAQRMAANILCAKWDDFFADYTTVTCVGGTSEYDTPEDAFGRRISAIMVVRNSLEYPLNRVRYRKLSEYTSSGQVSVPYVYAVHNRKYTIKPTPISGVVLKLWYPKAPETMVLPLGRITTVDAVNSYVKVAVWPAYDGDGPSLSTDVTNLDGFVNLVDGQSGKIKCTLQVSAATQSLLKVSFKTSSPTYSTVYNRTVATAIDSTVAVGDYVCPVGGTCVPDLPDSCVDFFVACAVNDVRRRMGEQVQDEVAMVKQFTDQVSRQWAGRESASRVANKARAWSR